MKDQYVGDVGDYAKYSLLRQLGKGRRTGVAWYYNAGDETQHGSHKAYLDRQDWASHDPEVFAWMQKFHALENPSLRDVEDSGLLPDVVFSRRRLHDMPEQVSKRAEWRRSWFENTMSDLGGCDFVFADPDTGLCSDSSYSSAKRENLKHIPVREALELAEGRMAMIYHHHGMINKRRVIDTWREALGSGTAALCFSAWTVRSFFVLNPDEAAMAVLNEWAAMWPKAELFA